MNNTIETLINQIHNIDCIEGMKQLPDNSVDLVCTSPPYNVGIDYDSHNDAKPMEEYLTWTKEWLSEVYRTLKDDGRIAINIPYEINVKDRGGRVFMASEYWQIMKGVGFGFFGIVDLEELSPHRSKTTAWGCYDKETKVMTTNGLKYFKDVDIDNDRFLTINPSTKHIEYQKAFDYIEKPFEGKLIKIKHKGVDLLITPNHNMLIEDKNGNSFVQPFNEIKNKNFTLPRTHNGLIGSKKDVETITIRPVDYGLRTMKTLISLDNIVFTMNDWLMFLGIFLTDGSLYYSEKNGQYKISIYQKKPKFIPEIESLLKRMKVGYKYKPNKNEYYFCSKQIAEFLLETSNKNTRKIPDYVFGCSLEQKELFLKWMFYGDGSFHKNGEMKKISVCSDIMCHQIVQLLFETGRNCSLYEYKPKDRVYNGKIMRSNHKMTTISIITKKSNYILRENITEVDYNDNVYCVSVPNKTLLVERGGQLMWCGNSWMSNSAPYIYNPKECVILAYKKDYKRNTKGTPEWAYDEIEIENEKGEMKKKRIYADTDKNEFMELVFGQWKYFADTKSLTKATFSMDIPTKAIKILTYKNDLILDPFSGSGTTAFAAKKLGRNFLGFEISPHYVDISRKRLGEYNYNQEIIVPDSGVSQDTSLPYHQLSMF